ncbi:MAG: DUF1501 domain-containing protein [Verrucomicrobiae bacterium]|nr:DUF1501 domain-containing protein [Verrucomicrobiae bacterium]MCP5551382.1 DUF1501 domain-containing protein [Akkermansiaceae bacterium]
MNPIAQATAQLATRRAFLRGSTLGLGGIALHGLAGAASTISPGGPENPLAPRRPPLAARAKRVIYLHMAGSPPQHDLFDWKPELVKHNGEPCPESLIAGERFAFIKGRPKLLGTPWKFERAGQCGTWVTELLPEFKTVIDDVCVVKSMHTTQFNHAPAQLFLYCGQSRFGFPSMGSWVTYGLGSESENLPGFVVLLSGGTNPSGGKALWSSGFLPAMYQGVQCRSEGDPVLYVNNPDGLSRESRRRGLDALRKLNELEQQQVGDPETVSRIAQYELAYRMQSAVPEVMDIMKEPPAVHEMYGTQPGKENFANNCLLARRLVEQGVRYVQLFDYGWDFHGTGASNDISIGLKDKTRDIDRPIAALLKDLKQRGLLDDTLVLWSGEFGRTSMNEERNGSKFLGRDHHPHCFTLWMAGGGVKPGFSYGETDEFGYRIVENKVTVHDLQATVLHLLGMDPFRFTYPFQGLDHRLIGVTGDAAVNHDLLA